MDEGGTNSNWRCYYSIILKIYIINKYVTQHNGTDSEWTYSKGWGDSDALVYAEIPLAARMHFQRN